MNKHQRDREKQEALDEQKRNINDRIDRAERFRQFLHEEGFEAEIKDWERQAYEAFIELRADQDSERFRLQTVIILTRKLLGWIEASIRDEEHARAALKEVLREESKLQKLIRRTRR